VSATRESSGSCVEQLGQARKLEWAAALWIVTAQAGQRKYGILDQLLLQSAHRPADPCSSCVE
jgi:hypothetical protein